MATNGNNNQANELGNPFTAAGIGGSALSGGSFPTAYGFAKKFVDAKSVYGSGNNGVTSIDDPTYLGFELMFDISSPLFNGTSAGDPGIDDGGSSSDYPSTPSAIGYLNKIGQANRVQYLKSFCQGMLEIQRTRPYYFQTISGLVEAFQKSTDFAIDPFTGSTGADGIAVGCLEALDLKITALFNMYRMAVYDMRYKRFVVPKNLCRFDIYINVHEIRKFRATVAASGADTKTYGNVPEAGNTNSAGADTASVTNENTSQIRFKFTECMFDVAASGKVFDGVTNSGGEIATTELKFGYSTLELISQYSGFASAMEEDKQQTSSSPGMDNKQKSFLKSKLDEVANKAAAVGDTALANLKAAPGRVLDAAQARIGGLIDSALLGNVFGLQNQILGALTNPGVINAALGAAIQGGLGGAGGSISTNLGDAAFDPAVAPGNSLTGNQQVFDPSTNTLGGLGASNVFGPSGPSNNSALNSENIFD
tara:strand:+ start:320 stop:1759 length:1440 start_codon:yes stop_codon:yes gene_type:complete